MESQSIESTDTKLSDTTIEAKPQRCFVAWIAMVSILITWLFLFLTVTFFWKKSDDIFRGYEVRFTQNQEQLSQIQAKYQVLQKNITQIQNLVQAKSPPHAATKVNYAHQLIQKAHDSLIYLHDLNNALAELTLADKQLVELSRLAPIDTIHNLLMQNIASLKALQQVDISHALTQLNTLQNQVIQLPLVSSLSSTKKTTSAVTSPTISKKKWTSAFQSSLRSFQQLIVIRHLDKPIEPLLPEIQQQYLYHNLKLLLQQAQWALLYRQQKIYQSSLQQAKEAIQKYFSSSVSTTQTSIQTINELEKINLQPNLPDLSPTLVAIASLDKVISNTDTNQKELH